MLGEKEKEREVLKDSREVRLRRRLEGGGGRGRSGFQKKRKESDELKKGGKRKVRESKERTGFKQSKEIYPVLWEKFYLAHLTQQKARQSPQKSEAASASEEKRFQGEGSIRIICITIEGKPGREKGGERTKKTKKKT